LLKLLVSKGHGRANAISRCLQVVILHLVRAFVTYVRPQVRFNSDMVTARDTRHPVH